MALSGTVFIDRANRATARKAFEGAANEIKREKQSVFIFPEGTRSYAEEPMLLGFKKGAFHLAIQAGVPIVPVVTGCYWGILGARERRFRAGKIPGKSKSEPVSTYFRCVTYSIQFLNLYLPTISARTMLRDLHDTPETSCCEN